MDELPSQAAPHSRAEADRPPRRLSVLLNARAAADPRLHDAAEEVRELGHTVELVPIVEEAEATRLARQAAEGGADTVVAAGGDGTVNEVVNGLHQAGRDDVALGLLPYGTANDFARVAGVLDCDVCDLLLYIVQAEPVPIDVGRVNDRLFLNMASGGLSAEVTTQTPRLFKEMLGGLAYSVVGLQKLFRVTPREARIRTPQWDWEGDVLFFAVGNGRFAGGGFQTAPHAVLDDGLLDLGLVPGVPREEFPQLLSELFILGRLDSPFVRYEQVAWLELDASEAIQVNADGEPLRDTHFRFDLLPTRRPVYVLQPAPLQHATPAGLCNPRRR